MQDLGIAPKKAAEREERHIRDLGVGV